MRFSTTIVCVVALALAFAVADSSAKEMKATVHKINSEFQVWLNQEDTAGVAYGSYSDMADHPSFFGTLKITTNSAFSDEDQMYAAGLLEGTLTADRVYEQYVNLNSWTLNYIGKKEMPQVVIDWFKKQDSYTREMVAKKPEDPFWSQVGLINNQFDGLVEGYNQAAEHSKALDIFQLAEINAIGDLLDLVPALKFKDEPDWDKLTVEEIELNILNRGHCSGLIKVTGDYSNLFAAHSSWFAFGMMLRIFKHYNFNLNNPAVKAKKVSFSSYPGMLSSLDDFYMMDSGLVMVQTTNPVLNNTLYELVKPESVLAWQRVRVACQGASTGLEWSQLVATENSGTYNNQYMVVDHKLFTPGKALPPGLLYVVEQIPGEVEYADQTETLSRGYWPSYNVPFYKDIYDKSGFAEFRQKYAHVGELPGLDYQLAPRAKIFRRDQATVTDLDSLKKIMRYNDFKNDPYANGDPMAAICSRGDLRSTHPSPSGCYDSKVTDFPRMQKLISEAINGPTADDLPPFSWADFEDVSHIGQPEVYDFKFEVMDPEW
eukprot:GFYU01002178.1.p1 GENE.GFYU01002178.1~~GFYU01002178.1.p1  ORF type:complete len:544 (+),score=219.20 GFYU01002178.1:76-1707(+)